MADDQKNKLVLIDGVEHIEVSQDDFYNEIRTLRTLLMGLKQICGMIKSKELAFERAGGDKLKVFTMGATSSQEQEFLDTVACFFHWFGVSVCNFARLVGFIRGLSRGDFTRADLKDPTTFKPIKESIKDYVSGIPELESVLVWRNKVFAHFAITDPYKDDNVATLDMSVIHPVTFENRYFVGGMTLRKSSSSGSHVSELPRWSLTEVFEALEPRFWPGLKYVGNDAPPNADAGEKGNDAANSQ